MNKQPNSAEALREYWQARENKEELIVIARAWRKYLEAYAREMAEKRRSGKPCAT